MAYHSIAARPIAGALGAEIEGVDLSLPLDNRTWSEILDAFHRYGVIFFRRQNLTPEQHKAFSLRFGPHQRVPFVNPWDAHPEMIRVVKEAGDRGVRNFGGSWHSDLSYLPAPALGSALYAVEVPVHGGDTLWASMGAAYAALSDGMRRLLAGLAAVHSPTAAYGSRGRYVDQRLAGMAFDTSDQPDRETVHPVVIAHPATGRKCLFVNGGYTIRFAGQTEAESKPLLDYLNAHAVRPEFTCRFRWSSGTLAVWDNRCTQHFAINDYDGSRREMRRTTIAGAAPRPA
ncbi:MAG: taurine dioxygenase [Alphaproteobacteria bacterium]|nr:taurine dioxygenase [Alphaproteobacteria bacterium]